MKKRNNSDKVDKVIDSSDIVESIKSLAMCKNIRDLFIFKISIKKKSLKNLLNSEI